MKIRQKLLLGAAGFALLIGIVGYISVRKSQESLEKSIGNGSTILAQETLDKIDRGIYSRIEEMLLLSQDRKIQNAITQSNREFEQMSDLQAYINEKDEEWVSVSKETETPFMRKLFDTKGSFALRESVDFYIRWYGYMVVAEFFITNRKDD